MEKYADYRESATWNRVVDKSIGDLPVRGDIRADRALIKIFREDVRAKRAKKQLMHVLHERPLRWEKFYILSMNDWIEN